MTPADPPASLGIIAGNRSLPILLARQARAQGVARLVAVAFKDETDPALADLVDEIVWLRVGQLSKMIAAFSRRGIRQCVMVGQIAPRNLFTVRPDLRALALLMRLPRKNAHSIFGAITDELERDGVRLVEATHWLRPLMPTLGYQAGPAPSPAQCADVEFGFRLAKEISRLDIGQTVVVRNGIALAIEAFEGTDRCLMRGGELARPQGAAVAVKVAKPHHDLRFDIPCLGRQTLETCAAAGIAVLAFESGLTLLLDKPEVEALAQRHRISLLAAADLPAHAPP